MKIAINCNPNTRNKQMTIKIKQKLHKNYTVGRTFGALTITKYLRMKKYRKLWECSCVCGGTTEMDSYALQYSVYPNCGCLTAYRYPTHLDLRPRMHRTRTYRSWDNMIQRCKTHAGYEHVTVCDRWNTSFDNFLEDMGEVPTGMTIDRIDNDLPYEPGNCRWASHKIQSSNKNTNLYLRSWETGQINIAIRWAEDINMSSKTFYDRLHKGKLDGVYQRMDPTSPDVREFIATEAAKELVQ